jgi:4-hydroxybenzoate polyprenyltransferase
MGRQPSGAIRPGDASAPAVGRVVIGILRESRPSVQGVFLLRFLAGGVRHAHFAYARMIVGAAVWLGVMIFVYVLNGVMDVVEDQANGSQRPVASGELSPGHALLAAGTLAGAAVCGGMLLSNRMLMLVVAQLALGYAYSGAPFRWKRHTVTAVATGALGGLITYLAGRAAAGGPNSMGLILFAVSAAAWMGLVGSTTKDLSDVRGDAAAGHLTISVRYGEAVGRRVAATAAIGIGGCFLAVSRAFEPPLLLPAAVLAVGALAVAVAALDPRRGAARSVQRRPYRVFMLAQYAVNFALIGTILG